MNFCIAALFSFVFVAHHANANKKSLHIMYKGKPSSGAWVNSHLIENNMKYPEDIVNPETPPLIVLLPFDSALAAKLDKDESKLENLHILLQVTVQQNLIVARFEHVKPGVEAQHIMDKFLGKHAPKAFVIIMDPEFKDLTDKNGKPYPSSHDDPTKQQSLTQSFNTVFGK